MKNKVLRVNSKRRLAFVQGLLIIDICLLLLAGFLGYCIGAGIAGRPAEKSPPNATAEASGKELQPDQQPPEVDEPQFESLGEFTTTAYCSCEQCCGKSDGITATGARVEAGTTVAVDPSVIPYGATIQIDGVLYIAQDTMAQSVKDLYGGKIIDIYFDSHEAALEYGIQTHEVYILAN